jgi:hypothetical protein
LTAKAADFWIDDEVSGQMYNKKGCIYEGIYLAKMLKNKRFSIN